MVEKINLCFVDTKEYNRYIYIYYGHKKPYIKGKKN